MEIENALYRSVERKSVEENCMGNVQGVSTGSEEKIKVGLTDMQLVLKYNATYN